MADHQYDLASICAEFESGAPFHPNNPFGELSPELLSSLPTVEAFVAAVIKDTMFAGIDAVAVGAFYQGLAIGYEFALRKGPQHE